MNAVKMPGPPELLPDLPDAVIDLQTEAGVELVQGRWRYAVELRSPGSASFRLFWPWSAELP